MEDGMMMLPAEVAIKISNHKFFIFEIYRLIQKGLAKPVTCVDFFNFLGTNYQEVLVFMGSRCPPKKWLMKLTQNKEGVKVLDYFGIYYVDPMVCFSPRQKEAATEPREIEQIYNVSGPKEKKVIDAKTEKLLDLGILDEADLIESVEPPNKDKITDEVVASVNEYMKKLNELSAKDETIDNSIKEKNIPERKGGLDMDTANSAVGNQDKLNFASIEEKNAFLVKVKTLLKISDNSVLKETLGSDEIKSFKETGVVLEKWKKIFREAGCAKFLGICDEVVEDGNAVKKVSGGEMSAKNDEKMADKKGCIEGKESVFIHKDVAKLVLPKIFEESGFKSKREFVVFLGLSQNSYNQLAEGNVRLLISDVEQIAKKKGFDRDEFFKKVGLDYLVKDSQDVKVETILEPAKNVFGDNPSTTDIKVDFKDSQEKKDETSIKPTEDAPNDLVSGKDSEVGLNEENTPCVELPSNEWMTFNKLIQLALFRVGGVPQEIRKEFFLGYLVRYLTGYSVEFFKNEKKICIKGHGDTSEFELGHIPF